MRKAMLADGHQQVTCRSGLPPEAEKARIVKSGTLLKRHNLLTEEFTLTFETGWDKGRVHDVLMKYRGSEKG